MLSSNWVPITAIENLPRNEGRALRWNGIEIAVFNLGNRVVALENRCPHQHGPIADGIVSQCDGKVTVTCPLHTRRICLESGRTVKPSVATEPCIRTFPAKIEDGILMMLDTAVEAEAA